CSPIEQLAGSCPTNENGGSVAARVRDFVRMNLPEFLVSQVGEDLQNFADEVKKIFGVMHVIGDDRVELASYQLKDDRLFPRELREAKAQEFMNLRQGSMSFQDYGLKFTQLSSYAPYMLADPRASHLVRTECRNAMLLEDMTISRLMTHAQQVEGDKFREQAKDNKKARKGNYDYSHYKKLHF
ncbi:hypothetical protein MTR67_018788, partial [Solanum verrucosum]